MCSPVRLRMFVSGTAVSRSPGATPGAAARCRRGAAGGAEPGPRRRGRRRCRGGALARRGAARRRAGAVPTVGVDESSTSSRVMRPPAPVPVIVVGVEAVLGDQPAHDRRQQPVVAGAGGSARPRRRRGAGAAAARARRGRGAGARPVPARARARGSAAAARRAGARRLGAPARLGGAGSAARRLGAPARPAPARRAGAVADDGEHRADVDGVALRHADLGERAGDRRRHLGVDLVGGHLEQRLVLGDRVADLLEPLGDRALGDGLTELGHRDVGHGVVLLVVDRVACQALRLRPVSDSTVSPNTSVSVGWGWMNSATSSTVASQLTAR